VSGRQAATQIGAAIATLFLAALLTYAALSALPGDPLAAFVAEEHRSALEPAQRAALMRELGLDGPFPLRFARWLGGVLEGDLGTSFRTRRPVAREIVERLGPTLELNLVAVALIAGIGLPLGWWAARRSAARGARWGSAALIALYAVPTLWVALVLQYLLSVRLGLLPLYGRTDPAGGGVGARLAHLALPAATLALHQIAFVTLFARDSAQAGFLSRHAHRARSAGLSERSIFARHGVRPSLVPLAALFGLMVPGLASGSVLIESVFAWPGLGTYFVHAVLARDLPVVMGLALLASSLTVAGSLVADALAGAADPRAAGAAEGRR
jgi:peptide/nickel transport system permease protein